MGSGKKSTCQTVSALLPEVARHKGWEVKLDMYSFFPIWDQVVETHVAQCSRPLKIVKNVLWIEVDGSAWMQQLQFEKVRILEAVNSRLSLSRLRDIRFVLPLEGDKAPVDRRPELVFVAPDAEELARFEMQAGIIEDDAIREALVRLWYLSKACRRRSDA